jgi:hypothetical protein
MKFSTKKPELARQKFAPDCQLEASEGSAGAQQNFIKLE